MLFLCGAAEMKCVDIGGGRAEKRSGAQYEYNNDERENKIIISCQSHTATLKVSPGNQHELTGHLLQTLS